MLLLLTSPFEAGGSGIANAFLAVTGWLVLPSIVGVVVAMIVDRQLRRMWPVDSVAEARIRAVEAELRAQPSVRQAPSTDPATPRSTS